MITIVEYIFDGEWIMKILLDGGVWVVLLGGHKNCWMGVVINVF